MAQAKNIDIIPSNAITRVHVSQGDIGRTIYFNLYEGSLAYIPTSGDIITCVGTKPSGLGFTVTCTWSGNVVTCVTTEDMTDESGFIDSELVITSSDESTVLGTSNFVLVVEENPHPSDTTDGTQTTAESLQVQINDLDTRVTTLESNPVGGGGQPTAITLASQMTDTDAIYLYLGNEEGYDYGYIYAYVGGTWTKTTLYGQGQQGQDGTDGTDGYSPTATVTQTSTGVEISITDEDGTTTAVVSNGTATDAQVDAWLDEHPEATTTVADNSITPNKTTFIYEPYIYDCLTPDSIQGSLNTNNGTVTESTTSTYQYTDLTDIDLSLGTTLTIAVAVGSASSAMITSRQITLYLDGTFVSAKSGGDKWASDGRVIVFDLSSYDSTTVNQIRVPTNYGNIVYITQATPSAYTVAEITKTYFDFRTGYKEEFYSALGLDDGGVTTDSIADGAVTGEKFGDESVEPRKLSPNTNMLDYSEIVTGKYLGNAGIISGNYSSSMTSCIVWIPVEPSETYTVNFVPDSFYFYGFWKSDKSTHVGTANYAVSAQTTSYDITVPSTSTIAYMAISAKNIDDIYEYGVLPKWKIWKTSYGEPDIEYSFDWLKLSDVSKVRSSIFRGKVIIATGDSITENNTRNDNKSWCEYLPEKLGVTVYNDGKSGTGLVKSYQSYRSLLYRVENSWDTDYADVNPDIILFMGNMNDGTGTGTSGTNSLNDLNISGWSSNGYLAVGTESDDINTQSVYGCSKRLLEDLITKYPSAQIGWILSTPRMGTVSYWTDKENDYGHGWFEDYITAIKYQCEQYNVPVLDLYHESGFRPTNSTNMNAYMDDGTTHPNTAGIKKYMVEPIVKWIEDKFGECS